MYDPNNEATNEEQVVAGHWELLRRNKLFRSRSARWLKSENFRRSFALKSEYHDTQYQTPRCAWDWMLTAAQRFRLAEFQIGKFFWVFDNRFNFGPIVCREKLPPVALTRASGTDFLYVEPLPNPPPPITCDQSWDRVPDLFKEQFRLAYQAPNEFGEINAWLNEVSDLLRLAARKLAAGDPLKETPIIANALFQIGTELHELPEFSKVFKIPKLRYSEKRFREILSQIQKNFNVSVPLVPTKRYDSHKSYQGTQEDWRWFLEAENLGFDIRKSADLRKLTERYSEVLRQRVIQGKAPRRAKAHGFSGAKVSGKAVKNRRNTLKRHVLAIEDWIQAAYPPGQPQPGAPSC